MSTVGCDSKERCRRIPELKRWGWQDKLLAALLSLGFQGSVTTGLTTIKVGVVE
jgi:hypothetical protein